MQFRSPALLVWEGGMKVAESVRGRNDTIPSDSLAVSCLGRHGGFAGEGR
jgi:hypothetical protein